MTYLASCSGCSIGLQRAVVRVDGTRSATDPRKGSTHAYPAGDPIPAAPQAPPATAASAAEQVSQAAVAAVSKQVTPQAVSAAILQRATGDGDGRTGAAALNDGDAAALAAANFVKSAGHGVDVKA